MVGGLVLSLSSPGCVVGCSVDVLVDELAGVVVLSTISSVLPLGSVDDSIVVGFSLALVVVSLISGDFVVGGLVLSLSSPGFVVGCSVDVLVDELAGVVVLSTISSVLPLGSVDDSIVVGFSLALVVVSLISGDFVVGGLVLSRSSPGFVVGCSVDELVDELAGVVVLSTISSVLPLGSVDDSIVVGFSLALVVVSLISGDFVVGGLVLSLSSDGFVVGCSVDELVDELAGVVVLSTISSVLPLGSVDDSLTVVGFSLALVVVSLISGDFVVGGLVLSLSSDGFVVGCSVDELVDELAGVVVLSTISSVLPLGSVDDSLTVVGFSLALVVVSLISGDFVVGGLVLSLSSPGFVVGCSVDVLVDELAGVVVLSTISSVLPLGSVDDSIVVGFSLALVVVSLISGDFVVGGLVLSLSSDGFVVGCSVDELVDELAGVVVLSTISSVLPLGSVDDSLTVVGFSLALVVVSLISGDFVVGGLVLSLSSPGFVVGCSVDKLVDELAGVVVLLTISSVLPLGSVDDSIVVGFSLGLVVVSAINKK